MPNNPLIIEATLWTSFAYQRETVFLTNNLDWVAGSVAELCCCHWQIEAFFNQNRRICRVLVPRLSDSHGARVCRKHCHELKILKLNFHRPAEYLRKFPAARPFLSAYGKAVDRFPLKIRFQATRRGD